MPRGTYQQAAQFADKSEYDYDVLKTPSNGGPSYERYSRKDAKDGDYMAHHPRYPDFEYPDDKARDTYHEMKSQMAADPFRFGLVSASDKDIQYILDKRNMQELSTFKRFVENSIPRGTPWARDFFDRIMPGWYESKKDIILRKMDVLNKFAQLTVTGIRSIDDMYLLWLLYTGKIELPTSIQDVIRPDNQGIDSDNFTSGLFNPKRWVMDQYRVAWRNQQYLANLTIPGVDLKGLDAKANPVTATYKDEEMGSTPFSSAVKYPYAGPGEVSNYFSPFEPGHFNPWKADMKGRLEDSRPNFSPLWNYRVTEPRMSGEAPSSKAT